MTDDHHTELAPELTQHPWDAIVIGGGVMGLSSAWTLAEHGRSVLLLEKDHLGAGASRAAAGMLAPYAEIEFFEDDLLTFAEQSQKLWPEFAAKLHEESGVDVEFDDTGTILVASDPDSHAELKRQVEYQQSRDAPVTLLSTEDCRAREPLLSPYITGGAYSAFDFQVSNRQVVKALGQAARNAGATIAENTEVTKIHAQSGQAQEVQLSNSQKIAAKKIVITAGAWTSTLTGIGRLPTMIRPVKGQMLALKMLDPFTIQHVIRGPGTYLVPKSNQSLVVGGTVEERGFDDNITAGGLFELLRGVYELLPSSYEFPLVESWVGFRPGSRDNGPLLGKIMEGLYVATGHYRNGIQQLPATHATMTHALLDKELPEWAAPFHCLRFELT